MTSQCRLEIRYMDVAEQLVWGSLVGGCRVRRCCVLRCVWFALVSTQLHCSLGWALPVDQWWGTHHGFGKLSSWISAVKHYCPSGEGGQCSNCFFPAPLFRAAASLFCKLYFYLSSKISAYQSRTELNTPVSSRWL